MPPVVTIPRGLTSHVLDVLREAVLSGRIAPGARLNEVEIAGEIGVSRGPVREALRCLVSEGLLVSVPNRGAHMLLPDRPYVVALFELRIALEIAGARLAASRAQGADIERLAEVCARSRSMWRAGERPAYQLDIEFHRALMEVARSPLIANQAWLVQQQVIISRNSFTSVHGSTEPTDHHEESFTAHEQIVKALATHDSAEVARLVETHLEQVRDQLVIRFTNDTQRRTHSVFNSTLPDQWQSTIQTEEQP
jgi:Transcriptional regulators